MLSVVRFRLALLVQLSFLGLHSVGLLLGTIYTSKTPDLYRNNVHNKVGWTVTWIVLVQCIIGPVNFVASMGKAQGSSEEERAAFLPMSVEALAHHRHAQIARSPTPHRYSHDSGHYTASEPSRSQSISSTENRDEKQQRKFRGHEDAHAEAEKHHTEEQGLLGNANVQRIASCITAKLS